MSHVIKAFSEQPEQSFDPDSQEGKEQLSELMNVSHLDYTTWLPFAAKTYKISPRIEDYILIVSLICPADLPNRNGIAFPLEELTKFQKPPSNRMAYKTWSGCPLHVEHRNSNCEDAVGAILDSSLSKVTGYGKGKLWKVMGLIGIDKTKDVELAQKVLNKEVNTYSMGAVADYFTCSFCGSTIEEHNHCAHIDSHGQVDFNEISDYDGSRHLVFRNARDLVGIEYSVVADPAWAPALSDHFLPSILKSPR